MKTMCPPGYHHNGFVATHALGHMMYDVTVHHVPKCMSCRKAIVVITGRAHCFHDYIHYAHLASVGFEHSVCRGSLMTTLDLFLIEHGYLYLKWIILTCFRKTERLSQFTPIYTLMY